MTYQPSILGNVSFDAGGRLRTSNMTTLFDGKTLGGEDTDIWQTVGTGTATYANNKIDLSVTAGQYMIRRGRQSSPYFSGKSQPCPLL